MFNAEPFPFTQGIDPHCSLNTLTFNDDEASFVHDKVINLRIKTAHLNHKIVEDSVGTVAARQLAIAQIGSKSRETTAKLSEPSRI